MTRSWLDDTVELARDGGCVRVVVIAARGSTPRDVGACMLVWATGVIGTIGGGALEYDAIARARDMLAAAPQSSWQRTLHSYHLGPELAQCCGGSMRLLFERFAAAEVETLQRVAASAVPFVSRPLVSGAPLRAADKPSDAEAEAWFTERVASDFTPVVIFGAGHVGRAVVEALSPLPFAVTWVDIADDRFPSPVSSALQRISQPDPADFVAKAARNAFHLVMTHSHALDEAIVAAVLERGDFAYLGLIGSETKRARFAQRLARRGLPEALVRRMTCPIGLPGVTGKAPAIIAASVAADLLLRRGAMAAEPCNTFS